MGPSAQVKASKDVEGKAGLLGLGAGGLPGQIILCGGGCAVHYGMCSSSPGLYPSNASCRLAKLQQANMPPDVAKWWGGGRQEDQNAPPGESHCSQEQGRGSLRLRCLFLLGCAGSSRRRRLFSGCSEWRLLFLAEREFLIVVAPLLQGSGGQAQ